ncbi:hypothetical protein NQ318_011981 [Aromia moschata]|uniref:EGF-like domain-containing protein n=1 Tax=Aromia moschata TaxID=1265417 RepID=A0AAV8XXV5_9CUCU|nr:hypothetical protein NQ318_011981 [Aromia moschata]
MEVMLVLVMMDSDYPIVCLEFVKQKRIMSFLLFANGPEIRSFDLRNKEETGVITEEKRIEAVDYNPVTEMVFWADSYDKTIKRSFTINAKDGMVKAGYAQDLEMKGNSKPTALAVDWVGNNLYWTETDRTGSKPKGRVMVAKTDGRYRRSLISVGLEYPTSIVVDPKMGRVFWTDAGSLPKIEVAWMDGSKHRPVITDEMRHPTGLAIDYEMDHTLYWVDTKLNTIETMRSDGQNRKVLLRGEMLKHPISLDVFESNLYWITKDTGELIRHDKFGRGVPFTVQKDLLNPSSVKVYHTLHYNTSIPNPCRDNHCSHLCLLIPNGYRCMCPDSSAPTHKIKADITCDAPVEPERPEPGICKCENDGVCRVSEDTNNLICECLPGYQGQYCDIHLAHSRSDAAANTTAIVVPIVVILLILGAATGVWFVIRKRPFGKGSGLGSLASSQSVLIQTRNKRGVWWQQF